jgi:ParB family chromosome partitioning protein
MNIADIDIKMIDEDKEQPRVRFEEESLQELMKSIEELGLLSPIKVRKTDEGRFKIIYGNRRYKACLALGRQTIPCIVSEATDELEIYLEQIAENLTREDFTPIEEAEAFDKLLHHPRFTSSIRFLSGRLGKTDAYVKNKLELLKFGPAVKKLVVSGTRIVKDQLTEEQLLPLKDLPLEHRDPLAQIVARDELPVSDVKKIARLFKDKQLSAGTKNKLLFKSGNELLETWYAFEQSKAERAKSASADTSAKSAKQESAGREGHEKKLDPTLESKLRELLAVLPAHSPLPNELSDAYGGYDDNGKQKFLHDVDLLIASLEQHLSDWRKVREQVSATLALSDR